MYFPNLETFRSLASRGNLIPVYREILSDHDTPVGAFRKIDDGRYAFLFESVEGGEKWGRYTFLGTAPAVVLRARDGWVEVVEGGTVRRVEAAEPLAYLREYLSRYRPVENPALPRFCGGAVGYLGYDAVRHFERLPDGNPRTIGAYDACFMIADTMLVFDALGQKIRVVSNAYLDGDTTPDEAYHRATARIDRLVARLKAPLHAPSRLTDPSPVRLASSVRREEFEAQVARAKEYVENGDVIQVVLSQRFSGELTVEPFEIYRALRVLNPSPYLFFLRLDGTVVVGSSPEVMVRKEGDLVEVRPIAGTRPRGRTDEEDEALARELLDDPKELAEHVMLVDLGRNDLGRVCRIGSVRVSERMVVERYSHVMHIVSNVQGELDSGRDAFDVVRATFPAGTLSGAPKVRAMEIIDELEGERREVYGGAIGYFSFSGNTDMAIAIRTLVVQDGKVHLQAGAGIVADSDPTAEYQETLNKAMCVVRAIELAERGLE